MATISQNISVPAGLADGQTAQAAHVTPLYAALNAFVIPNTIGVFAQGFVDNNSYSVAGGASQDWSFTNAANKAIIFMLPFSWTGATAGTSLLFTQRMNGAAITTATGLAPTLASSGDGMLLGFIGGHGGATVTKPAFTLGMETSTGTAGVTVRGSAATLALPTADTSSVGFTFSTAGAAATVTFVGVRFWVEG